ncbi:hypothetical protein G6011_02849 [Alternaria panax]|uniref:Uncharacterized protein n=1 Tax=Alternaria panax TaxID=48097 RepID=A0AAD4FAD3_9PLEO|nr:hypothetical protein G6011_02849 [Alternaria panax]
MSTVKGIAVPALMFDSVSIVLVEASWGTISLAQEGTLSGTLAFPVAQHKAELGTKHVTAVTIFRKNNDDPNDNDPYVYMLYRIEDIEEMDTS